MNKNGIGRLTIVFLVTLYRPSAVERNSSGRCIDGLREKPFSSSEWPQPGLRFWEHAISSRSSILLYRF